MNAELVIFYLFSIFLIISSLYVVTSNNPIKSAIYLVFSFFFSAILWLLLGAEFLSVILILVYVGAVMVLFLFVVMMLDINLSEITGRFVKYLKEGIFVFITMATLLILFFQNQFSNTDKNILTEINIISDSNTKNLGYVLYTEYILAFEVAAVILLLGIISAITLTHRKKTDNKYQDPSMQISVKKEDRITIIKDEDLK